MSSKRKRSSSSSPPRTPDTVSTVVVGSVNSNQTKSTIIDGSPTNESYRTPSVSSAHDSQQVSPGMRTATTIPYSLTPKGSLKYLSPGKEKSSNAPISPLTPQSQKRMRKTGGKKTRSTRKNKSKRRRT